MKNWQALSQHRQAPQKAVTKNQSRLEKSFTTRNRMIDSVHSFHRNKLRNCRCHLLEIIFYTPASFQHLNNLDERGGSKGISF